MKLTDLSQIRLANHKIADPEQLNIAEVVNWMGALQAQDFAMSKWGIGIRVKNSTEKAIESAFDKGEILRTHLLRPTWHIVSSENISWMLELTAPAIKSGLRSRNKELELNGQVIKKCNKIIHGLLKDENHLTRDEIFDILVKNRIAVNNQRGVHILMNAELDGIICSGKLRSGKHTYALLNERAAKNKELSKEEALKKLALIYFSSRGPASLPDFKWWSGLTMADARKALEIIRPGLISENIGSEVYWFIDNFKYPSKKNESVYFLPAFDEFLISYKDRSASLPLANLKRAVSDNGIFRPVIVVNGQVLGLWKRTFNKGKLIIEANLFKQVSRSVKDQIETASGTFGLFAGKTFELKSKPVE